MLYLGGSGDARHTCAFCPASWAANDGPLILLLESNLPVCRQCAQKVDPSVYEEFRRICTELDRGAVGPGAAAWLESLA